MQRESIYAERSVIGCLVLFPELGEKLALLEEGDFEHTVYRSIFKQLRRVYDKNGKLDSVTVLSQLEDPDERREVVVCCETAVSRHHFEEHLRLLKEMASQRRLMGKINDLMFSGECSLPNVQKVVEDETGRQLFVDCLEENKARIDAFTSNLNKPRPTIRTGFATMDNILGGIRKGCVFIIGARPSTGKTTFAINIAYNQMKYGQKVLFFSLEMSSEMIFERVMAAENKIKYERFSQNRLSEDEVNTVKRQMEHLKENNQFIVVDDVYAVELMCNQIAEVKPDLVVVDFIQIVTSTQKYENVRVKTDYISSELKRAAKKTGCTILVLSQLSRNGREAPTMSDLKESGGLEQDGDYIALLHRPYVLKKDDGSVRPEETELLLDKNKFGRTGKINLYFDLKHQKFYEADTYRSERLDDSKEPFSASDDIPF